MSRPHVLLIYFSWVTIYGNAQSLQQNLNDALKTSELPTLPGNDSSYYFSLADTDYGIVLYENLNYNLGGDSIRNDNKGYAAVGWIEDYYPSGKLLHRGYYGDGYLRIYKNFYPGGGVERSYRSLDNYHSIMEKFYADGALKSKVEYKEGVPLRWEDFYPSGKLEYLEEFNKTLDYYLMRKSFYENGQISESLELIKESKKLFENKQFNQSGILITEGKLIFNNISYDYYKEGKWSYYDDTGKLIREEYYISGKLNREKNL